MIEYVLCFCQCKEDEIVVIRKDKPEWQKNRYNIPGGKIEDGETPQEAALRELFEETGIAATDAEIYGKIVGADWIVYVCNCFYWDYYGTKIQYPSEEPLPNANPNELVVVCKFHEILDFHLLIPNHKIILPLCRNNVKNWILRPTNNNPLSHQWEVTFHD